MTYYFSFHAIMKDAMQYIYVFPLISTFLLKLQCFREDFVLAGCRKHSRCWGPANLPNQPLSCPLHHFCVVHLEEWWGVRRVGTLPLPSPVSLMESFHNHWEGKLKALHIFHAKKINSPASVISLKSSVCPWCQMLCLCWRVKSAPSINGRPQPFAHNQVLISCWDGPGCVFILCASGFVALGREERCAPASPLLCCEVRAVRNLFCPRWRLWPRSQSHLQVLTITCATSRLFPQNPFFCWAKQRFPQVEGRSPTRAQPQGSYFLPLQRSSCRARSSAQGRHTFTAPLWRAQGAGLWCNAASRLSSSPS